MKRRRFKLSNKTKNALFSGFLFFCALVIGSTACITNKTIDQSTALLEEALRAELRSAAWAAREIIDEDSFNTYDELSDLDNDNYRAQADALRGLVEKTNISFIYAMKLIDGEARFIFDTDPEADLFSNYQLTSVYRSAFNGSESIGISNVDDEFGSFSTGAVPIRLNNEVIGIVGVDISDEMLVRNKQEARSNFILMISTLTVLFAIMAVLVYLMLRRIKRMQDELKHMANFDRLTNLPNRQHLLESLKKSTTMRKSVPFALLFIDLDNFKKVNDTEGHHAGDMLLYNIGQYLKDSHSTSRVYRPEPGELNIAARIGGDEFILIAPGIKNMDEAGAFANELLSEFDNRVGDPSVKKYGVGLSIGIALYPGSSTDYNELIRCADVAMYQAKKAGKSQYSIYQAESGS